MERIRPKAPPLSKGSAREESERLVREALAKGGLTVTRGNTRIEAQCSKCGAPARVEAKPGETRAKFKCKECGLSQMTL